MYESDKPCARCNAKPYQGTANSIGTDRLRAELQSREMYRGSQSFVEPLVWGIDSAVDTPAAAITTGAKLSEVAVRQLLSNKMRELRLQEIENSREIRKVKELLYSFAPEVLDQPASRIRALNEYL